MDIAETTTCVEWCAGYAGISLGLARVIPSLRVIAFSEIEAYACANLVAKMEAGLLDPAPIWTNLKSFPCEQFRDRVGLFLAGYPCQPFSFAGARKGKRDPRHLWPFIRSGYQIMRPRAMFFENVEGHINLGLREVLRNLEEDGYRRTWGIFSAQEIGAAHVRKRLFIYAELADAKHLPGSTEQRTEPRQRSLAGPEHHAVPREAGGTLENTERPFAERRIAVSDETTGRRAYAKSGGSSGTLADARCVAESRDGGSIPDGEQSHGETVESGGSELDDATRSRRIAAGSGPEAVQHSGQCLPGSGRDDVADAPRARRGQVAPENSGLREAAEPIGIQLPYHAPGPGLFADGVLDRIRDLYARDPEAAWAKYRAELRNSIAWARILEIDPTLEPALCKLAHVRPFRVDELRLAGNGVCPDAAAIAYVTLWQELNA